MLLNSKLIKNEIKEQTNRYLEINEDKNTTTQNLWDTLKAFQKGKFIVIKAYLN